jgi:hypothetical protein
MDFDEVGITSRLYVDFVINNFRVAESVLYAFIFFNKKTGVCVSSMSFCFGDTPNIVSTSTRCCKIQTPKPKIDDVDTSGYVPLVPVYGPRRRRRRRRRPIIVTRPVVKVRRPRRGRGRRRRRRGGMVL